MNKKHIIIIVSAVILLSVFWGIFSGSKREAENDLILSPQKGRFLVTVTETGELRAKNSQKINGPANARMAGIWQMKISKLVPEGSRVKKGDFVAELDKSSIGEKLKEIDIEIQKSTSQHTQVKLDTTLNLQKIRDDLINLKYQMEENKLEMEQSIYEAPSVKRQAEINYEKSERQYRQNQEAYQTKVKQAMAKMKEAETSLNQQLRKREMLIKVMQDFTIKAPATGMVVYIREWSGKKRTIGSTVSPWEPGVATLPDLSVMESVTYINELDIQKLKIGQKVNISLDAAPKKKMTGKISAIANIGEKRPNSDSKVFETIILINQSDSTLRPAMTTSNTIVIDALEEVLSIPLECIHAQDKFSYVYKKSLMKIVKQEVELGLINENHAIIKKGLTEKDKIYLSIPEGAQELDIEYLPESEQLQSTALK